MSTKTCVALIFGGRSREHDVSLMSAESVMGAIDRDLFDVVSIGITKEGHWFSGPRVLEALQSLAQHAAASDDIDVWKRKYDLARVDGAMIPFAAPKGRVPSGAESRSQPIDVFFPVLHGPYGEDGTVQGLFQLADIPFVGSGLAASAVGMDKAMMKALFRQAGLPVVDDVIVTKKQWRDAPDRACEKIRRHIGFPCFVKPANMGSSVGISRVDEETQLEEAFKEASRYDRKMIVERAAIGYSEVECAVIGNDNPQASIVGEVVPTRSFYDYEAKYFDDSSQLIIPARLSDQLAEKVRKMSIRAFQAIDGAGLARVDFFVDVDKEDVLVNEINTMPGFTRISMYPKLWEASGLPYKELITRLVHLAFERYNDV